VADQRGSTVVEVVLVIPVLMLILVTLIQFALWAHAAQVVQLAASEGDRTARSLGGSPAQGVSRAQTILDGTDSDLSSSGAVVVVMPGDQARITVTGTAISLLPGISIPVSAVQVGPIQEFRSSE
jgi:Flp pilus assembly protein TadG